MMSSISLAWLTVVVTLYVFCTTGVSEDMDGCSSAPGDCDKCNVINKGRMQGDDTAQYQLNHDGDNYSRKTETNAVLNSSFRFDSRFRGEYTFPVEYIERMKCSDAKAMDFFHKGTPVILEGCAFPKPALKWTLKFLQEHLRDQDHALFISPNHKFLYFDDELLEGAFEHWRPPTEKRQAYFEEFLEIVDQLKEANNGSYAYFQSPLVLREGVSSTLKDDVEAFDYSWLLDLVMRMGWGEDVVNLLLVGMPNVVTPAHYDILENLFVQLSGRKRCILFSPDFYRSLYPYPIGHPHDRQSQVDFDNPDFDKFPRFRDIRGVEAVVEPGEVLYIPNYWWHYIESEKNSMTISLNFWFEPKKSKFAVSAGASESQEEQKFWTKESEKKDENENGEETGKDKLYETKQMILSPQDELGLMRHVEMSLFRATRNHEQVRQMLEAILAGRFNYWHNNSSQ